MENDRLLVLDVSGSARERGRQIGEGARTQIQKMLTVYRDLVPQATGMKWPEALNEARKFLPYAEQSFPQFVDELRGLTEGANAAFDNVWTLNCYEGLTQREEAWGCTSIAVRDDLTTDSHVLLAHNEDWLSQDREHVYLVRAKPDDGPAFLAMSYGPLLVNIGFNAEGIGVAIDSVYPNDVRVGVPRIVCSRSILSMRRIGQAIRACVHPLRAGGYNYMLADPHGEIYCVETSATSHVILYGKDGWLTHTNNYLSPEMRPFEESGPYAGSQVRANRAGRLVQARAGRLTVEDLQAVLRDHVNVPDSICAHEDPEDPPHDRGQTVVSLVMDLSERVLWAAPGPPCQGEFQAYPL